MFAPGKGLLEVGAGGGDGKSFISLTELVFEAVSEGIFSSLSFRTDGGWRVKAKRRRCVACLPLSGAFAVPTPYNV